MNLILPNMNLIPPKEFLIYHCGCHGTIVTIATEHVTDAYYPKLIIYGRHTDLVGQYKKNICQMFADSIS